jgi:hypothetical protein
VNGAGRPAGLHGAERPDLGKFSACPFSFAPCARNSLHSLLLLSDMSQSGAGRPKKWPKNFEIFCEVLVNAYFQKSNVLWLKTNILMQRKLNYPICNAMMDTYHGPHGAGSGFDSVVGLSLPLVRLSSLVRP